MRNLVIGIGLALFSIATSATEWVSHRGVCDDDLYPCNTAPAFDRAIARGFHAIELDVRITHDLEYVIIHDDKLAVTTNCDGRVFQYNLAQLYLCRVEASTTIPESPMMSRSSTYTSTLMSLQTFLERYAARSDVRTIVIDIKEEFPSLNRVAFEKAFKRIDRSLDRKVIAIARNLDTLRGIKIVRPGVRIALEGPNGTEAYDDPSTFLKEVEATTNVISLSTGIEMRGGAVLWGSDYATSTAWAPKRAHAVISNLFATRRALRLKNPVMVWTVNNPDRQRQMIALGADYMLTDSLYPFVQK